MGSFPADYNEHDVYYIAGNLPILITVPHGGFLDNTTGTFPSSSDTAYYLHNRTYGCGTQTDDVSSLDMACELFQKIKDQYTTDPNNPKYPHVIINRLARIKIDQNRNVNEDCNPYDHARGLRAWKDFHVNFREIAMNNILNTQGRGLYIDLHGKANYGADIDIGYHLTSTQLGKDDGTINGLYENSSIRFLKQYLGVTLVDLIRGSRSFGDILDKKIQIADNDGVATNDIVGYHVAPSTYKPKPSTILGYYMSGEFNTDLFCGVKEGSTDYNDYKYYINSVSYYSTNNYFTSARFINGFQLEVKKTIRDSAAKRQALMKKVAESIKEYLLTNYNYQ
jgi:hypothetical protein